MPPGRCRCKYCNPGRENFSQKKLNNLLVDGYKAELNERKEKEYQAAKSKRRYSPGDQPLVKVFLKDAPGSRPGPSSNSYDKTH
jgi:hypothetical protein